MLSVQSERGKVLRNSLLMILVIRMAPGTIYLLPYFAVYNKLKMLDTHIGLIIIYLIFNVPLIIWMLLPVWSAIPHELEEAAVIDGANLWQVMVLVDIPLVRIGIILSAAMLAFIFSWNQFLLPHWSSHAERRLPSRSPSFGTWPTKGISGARYLRQRCSS